MKHPDFVGSERAHYGMEHALVMEQAHVSRFPIVRVHSLRRDTRSLQAGDERASEWLGE